MLFELNISGLRQVVDDVQAGKLDDLKKIRIEIQIWETLMSWGNLYCKSMNLVQELGERIDRRSYFATDVIGIETLDRWIANPDRLQAEKEKLTAELAEADKLMSELKRAKSELQKGKK
ncbi:MAG: hypothetical protein WB930_16115 [Syntrophobacteraceae bacterium]